MTRHLKAWALVAALLGVLLVGSSCSVAQTTPVPPAAPTDSAIATGPASPAEPDTIEAAPEPAIVAIPATVVRVVDGDTAVFQLEGGKQEKVRFIGIDTPEFTKEIEPYGREASAYTKKALPAGKQVLLERDVEERDRYGRLLAYVWYSQPTQINEAEIRSKMLNARLALDGYAQQMTIQPNSKYAEYFTGFVAEARDAREGLWGIEPAAEDEPAAAPAAAPKPKATSASYIGNRNTMKFHYATCSSVGDMNPANKVPMTSRDQAISGGYVPCKRCNP